MRATPEMSAVPSTSPSSAGNAPPSHELGQSLKATQSALRRSQRELRIRSRIAEIFLTVPNEETYGEVLDVVLEALESKHGVFGYIDEHGDQVCPSLTRDVWQQCSVSDKTTVFPRETWAGIWGKALTEQRSFYSNQSSRVPEGHLPIYRSLAVPILFHGETIGLFHVANKPTNYSENDRRLLEAIAGHVAPILHARLQTERQQKELRQHREHLEEMVEERTAELKSANARLLIEVEERRQAEKALRQSESRFRQVLETSSDLICRLDLTSGTYDYISPSVLRITGFTQEEFAALAIKGVRHRVHPEDWPQFRERFDGFVERGSPDAGAARSEHRWQCKDGQYRWFSDNLALIFGDGGQVVAMVSTVRDTTERHQAEEALRQSEERFRSLSAFAPMGIFLTDAEGRTVYANDRLREITGLTVEQNMGLGWTVVIHPEDRETLLADRAKAVADGREFTLEYRLVAPHRAVRWVRLHSRPMLSPDGRQIGRVGTVEDITEHREAQERERRLQEQEARTGELRTAVRLLEQMAATLAHELRNPLGVISNSAYFLSNQAAITDPRARKHAETISREVQSARRVIDDILEFAHVPQIVPSPASLNVVVDQALARSQVPANIRLTRKFAPDLPLLVCDAERLERAFLDVIVNAVQAMPHGGRLCVKTRPSAGSVTVTFSDTGEGIARQNLAKVFDPMFTTKLRGIGLGLTVVRRTVEQHGGTVDVESTVGRGTSVIIALPLAPAALTAESSFRASPDAVPARKSRVRVAAPASPAPP